MKHKKMRGAVDPFGLGLIITLVGALLAHSFHSNSDSGDAQADSAPTAQQQLERVWDAELDV